MIPLSSGVPHSFLTALFFSLFGFSLWGYFKLVSLRHEIWNFTVLCAAGPGLLFFLFFIFSSQIWDATSFRYLAYEVVCAAVGFGLGFHFLCRRSFVWGAAVLAFWILAQGSVLTFRLRSSPDIYPAVAITEGFKKIGLRSGYANHWVAGAGSYLSNNEVLLSNYEGPYSWRAWRTAQEDKRIGLVLVEGLDPPEDIPKVIQQLRDAGYRPTRNWPMIGHWSILEFEKK